MALELVAGPYGLDVPGNAGAWTIGPTFKAGETLRVRVTGAIRWAQTANVVYGPSPEYDYHWGDVIKRAPGTAVWSGPNMGYSTGYIVLPASTTSQTITSTAGNVVVEGSALPNGSTIVGVRLEINPAVLDAGAATGDVTALLTLYVGGASVASSSTPLVPGQSTVYLGNPTSLFGRTWTSADLSSVDWTLQLVNNTGSSRSVGVGAVRVSFFTPGAPLVANVVSEYALPEGAYPIDYPQAHGEQEFKALQNAGWTGSTLPATNTAPLSLAMIVLPDGVTPSLTGHANALRPNRQSFFGPTILGGLGATDPNLNYRVWAIFNDGSADFSDDAGSYTVIIDRYVGTLMSNPVHSLERPQFGVETTYGTQAAAARILTNVQNEGFTLTPEQTKDTSTTNGFAFSTSEETTTEMSRGSIKGMLDYRDLGYVLNSVYGVSTDNVLSSSAGISAVQHLWSDDAFNPITPQSYSFEYVKDVASTPHGVQGLVFLGVKIDTSRDKQADMSANVLARVINDNITPSTGANAVFTATVNGGPTGGTFSLQLDNLFVTNLAYNATGATIQTAIRALGGIWATATVTGAAGGPWVITNTTGQFVKKIEAIYYDASGNLTLTGGTAPTVTVVYTTRGGMAIHDYTRSLPGQMGVYFGTNLSDLVNAPSLLTDEFETNIDIADRFEAVWRQNPNDVSNAYVIQKKPGDLKDTITLTMAYTSLVSQFITSSKNDTRMALRIKWTGGSIGLTGQRFTIIFDASGILHWNDTSKDSQGNVQSVEFTFNIHHHIQTGFRTRWTIINDVANYLS